MQTNTEPKFLHIKKITYYFVIILLFFNSRITAQNDTIFKYNSNNYSALCEAKWYNENDSLTTTKKITPQEDRRALLKPMKFSSDQKSFNKEYIDMSPAFYISYSITTKSQLTGGLEFCLDCQNDNKLLIGLGYGITRYDGNTYGLVDYHLSYNLTEKWLFAKIGGSNKNAYAIAGLTIFNLLDLGLGYSAPFNTATIPVIKGFTFGATIRFTDNDNLRLNFNY